MSGILIGNVSEGFIFHTISWESHISKRPVRSNVNGEILVASEAVDEGSVLIRVFALLFDIIVEVIVTPDSRDLFRSLSLKGQSIDRAVCAAVTSIHSEFELRNANRIVRISSV